MTPFRERAAASADAVTVIATELCQNRGRIALPRKTRPRFNMTCPNLRPIARRRPAFPLLLLALPLLAALSGSCVAAAGKGTAQEAPHRQNHPPPPDRAPPS